MALTEITTKSIKDGEIVNADINASADIAGSKLADDSIAEVKLDVHNAPSGTDKFLAYTSNGMEWAVPSTISFANDANNRVVTGTGSGLNGEANLTYDGNHLTQTIDSSAQGIKITTAGNVYPAITCDANRTSEGQTVAWLEGKWNGTSIGGIAVECGDDTTNKDDGKISFYTTASGTQTKKMAIEQNGNVEITDGDLVIGTGGHGINFEAQTSSTWGGVTTGDETLDHYEEGTWTPINKSGQSIGSGGDEVAHNAAFSIGGGGARYTRIGNIVHICIDTFSVPSNSGNNSFVMGGLPFTNTAINRGLGDLVTTETDAHKGLVVTNTTYIYFYPENSTTASNNQAMSGATIYGINATYTV